MVVANMVEGMVDKILAGKAKNDTEYCMTPNGAFFRKDVKGFLPELMESMYNDRVKYKRLMLEAKQEYEDTGEHLFTQRRYLDTTTSKWRRRFLLIPLMVQLAIIGFAISICWLLLQLQRLGSYLYGGLKKVSTYILTSCLKLKTWIMSLLQTPILRILTFDKLVDKLFPKGTPTEKIINFLDKIASEKLEPFIDKSYQHLAKEMNAYEQKMQMAREAIADKGIWTAKKRYILNVWDMEGVRFKEPNSRSWALRAVKFNPCTMSRED